MKNFKKDTKSSGAKGTRGRSARSSEKFQTTCSTCGAECEVPFKPTGAKPVLCNLCFNKGSVNPAYRANAYREKAAPKPRETETPSEQLKRKLEMIDTKLDIILKLLSAE